MVLDVGWSMLWDWLHPYLLYWRVEVVAMLLLDLHLVLLLTFGGGAPRHSATVATYSAFFFILRLWFLFSVFVRHGPGLLLPSFAIRRACSTDGMVSITTTGLVCMLKAYWTSLTIDKLFVVRKVDVCVLEAPWEAISNWEVMLHFKSIKGNCLLGFTIT